MTKEALSSYELLRQERIKRNNERLAALGLLDPASRRPLTSRKSSSSSTTPKRKRMSNSTSPKSAPGKFTPTRASRRLSGKPALYKPLDDTIDDVILPKRRLTRGDEDDEDDTLFMGAVEAAVTSSSASPNVVSRFRIEIPDVTSSPLSEEEKVVLAEKVGENFLEMMETYLTNIDTISERNRKSVLRQITKLYQGQGIRYESKAFGWPEGCYFMQGTKIGPQDDILKLMEIGRQCERRWGQDHGNGWLLSHPLKKLYMFQQYYVNHCQSC